MPNLQKKLDTRLMKLLKEREAIPFERGEIYIAQRNYVVNDRGTVDYPQARAE